jgi:voltage-gated potassium channel
LPRLGWLTVDRELTKRLEKLFSVPMMVMALLSLPILVIEVFFAHWVEGNFALGLVLDACMSLIWAMFTIEFVIMFSISLKKFGYLIEHWIDLLIIVLPIIQALPFLRALRFGGLMRLEQLQRMNQLYRLRRVAAKLWRALLLLDLLNRLIGRRGYPRRIRNLEEKLQLKLEEVEEIRQLLAELKEKLAAYEAEKAAKAKESTEVKNVG